MVVATTTDPADDPVAALAARAAASTSSRGSDDDVLARFLLALDSHPADAVVRFTADCPLLDPRAGRRWSWRPGGPAPTSTTSRTVVLRTLPRGLDVELATVAALREADRVCRLPSWPPPHPRHGLAVHATGPLPLAGIVMTPAADDLRVTLDTPEDWALVEALAQRLGDAPPPWRQVVQVLRADPGLVALNAHITQKRLDEG